MYVSSKLSFIVSRDIYEKILLYNIVLYAIRLLSSTATRHEDVQVHYYVSMYFFCFIFYLLDACPIINVDALSA